MATSFACIIKGCKNRSLFQSLQGRVFLQNGGLFMPSVMMHNEVRYQGRLKCFKILLLGYAVKCEPIQTSSLFTFDYSCLFVITPLGIETHPFSAMPESLTNWTNRIFTLISHDLRGDLSTNSTHRGQRYRKRGLISAVSLAAIGLLTVHFRSGKWLGFAFYGYIPRSPFLSGRA